MIQSPLNYTGGKYKLLPQILPYFPEEINTFVDLFCGGCNVGINVTANNYIYNDICEPLISLFSNMNAMNTDTFVDNVENIIQNYNLSDVKTNGYEFYHCNSIDGLSNYNRPFYTALKNDFNNNVIPNQNYYIKLYVLIVFAFNNQIRFNQHGKFNLPPGKRDFNRRMVDKLRAFMNALHNQDCIFMHRNFNMLSPGMFRKDDFVYADPPYLITCASYNEQNGWNEDTERELLNYLDLLTANNIRFALSNVIETKGQVNVILKDWIEANSDYRMIDLSYTYNNSNYQRHNSNSVTREILVLNY